MEGTALGFKSICSVPLISRSRVIGTLALNRLTDYLGAHNEPPMPTYAGGAMGFRGAAETMSTDGKRRRNYLPGLSAPRRATVRP